jgi:hypothetical protein
MKRISGSTSLIFASSSRAVKLVLCLEPPSSALSAPFITSRVSARLDALDKVAAIVATIKGLTIR